MSDQPTPVPQEPLMMRLLPDSIEGCLDEANEAYLDGREFDRQIHMARLGHIAAGKP